MKIRLPRRLNLSESLRELARRKPDEAEEYIDTHQAEWEALAEAMPEDAADILEAIDDEPAAELLTDLDAEEAGEILDEMRPEAAADVLEQLDPAAAADLIASMEVDQAADVVGALDPDLRTDILAALDPDVAAEIAALLQYPPDTAGGMMTTQVAALPVGMTTGEAIEALRRLHDELGSNLLYVYVVDDEGKLVGVVSFRDLIFARPGQGLDEVMVHDPVRVTTSTDREEVSELIQRFHLIAIPVVDENDRLVGMVKVREAIEAVQAEATEDIAQMVGAGAEETVFTPIPISIRRRLPWIVVNMAIGFVIATVIFQFEDTIAANAKLAAYLPMASLLAGNSGAQSLAVIIRSLAVGDLPAGRAAKAIRREFLIGLNNGIFMAVLTGLGGGFLAGSTEIGLIIGTAVIVDFLAAGLAGAGIPVLFRRLGLDPALASNIFLTITTDLVGFTAFLVTARVLL